MEEKCHLSHFFSPPVFSSAQKIPKVAYQYEEDRDPARADNDVYNSWLKSRTLPQNTGTLLAPGNHRPFDHTTLRLAYRICKMCFPDILRLFFALHPWRTVLMIILQLVRGMLPVFKGFSHAVLIDEVQSMITSGNFLWLRLAKLAATEVIRAVLEFTVDSIASSTENIVHTSARFLIEYKQMEQRVRLDVPTLANPIIRDLLHESDLFVRSFVGGSSFGLFSMFDFTRVLVLFSELVSHLFLLSSLFWKGTHSPLLFLSLLSAVLPPMLTWLRGNRTYSCGYDNPQEAHAVARQEKMRRLAYSDYHRSEVLLFGLGPWVLQSWARARRTILGFEHCHAADESGLSSQFWSYLNSTGLLAAVQNLPVLILLQSNAASLGMFTLYRSSIHALFFTAGSLITTLRLAFQGVFLMGAFCAAMHVQPQLQPTADKAIRYRRCSKGMKIELKNLTFSYPTSRDPVLKDINLTIEAGETLAIVGLNGSGKSTLANVLLRILDFDSGIITVNGLDIRRYRPADYHAHITSVFQGFSKYDGSVKENVGVGLIQELQNPSAVHEALRLAGAADFVKALPQGMKTKLKTGNSESSAWLPEVPGAYTHTRHELSGGEWQRLAISRALMRAHCPEVELILLDEPTSSLDAHAQNRLFNTVEKIATSSTGGKIKTVIFITHRLSTARRADKIAMMERGRITEFGTHEELLQRDGAYATLYRASV